MKRNRWHSVQNGGDYTLSRRLPAKFDVFAIEKFPFVNKRKLALQVRQDLWRELRGLRGFSPVIHISTTSEGLLLKAGGECAKFPPDTESRIKSLLENPKKRARWLAWSKLRDAQKITD